MKLRVKDKVYLQKYEVDHIVYRVTEFNQDIIDEIFINKEEPTSVKKIEDRYSFSCIFKNPGNIDWLMGKDWIVDYNDYDKISITELKEFRTKLIKNLRRDIRDFNASSSQYRNKHYATDTIRFYNEKHKIISLGTLLEFRQGMVDFTFPSELGLYQT